MKNILTLSALAAVILGWAGVAHAEDNTVLDDYVAVSSALAQDDLPAAKTAAGTLAAAAKTAKNTALAEHAAKVASSESLEAAREQFKATSAEAVKLASGNSAYYVFKCPMVKAEWVQKSKEVANPYMGKEMPGCGSMQGAHAMGSKQAGGCCG